MEKDECLLLLAEGKISIFQYLVLVDTIDDTALPELEFETDVQ